MTREEFYNTANDTENESLDTVLNNIAERAQSIVIENSDGDKAEPKLGELTLFDYSLLEDEEAAEKLRGCERVIRQETAGYFTLIGLKLKEAQDILSKAHVGTFEKWYSSLGFKRQTVYRLIQRYEFISSPTVGGNNEELFEGLPLSLSYSISKPSAPAELVEQVMSGDITTNAEYQRLLKELEEQKDKARFWQDANSKTNAENQQLRGDRINYMNKCNQAERRVKELESRPIDVAVQEVPQSEEHFNEVLREIEHKYILQADEADKELAEMRNERNELREKLEKQLARSKPDDDTAQLRAELERLKNPNVKLWGLRLTVEEMTELISISEQLGLNVKQAVSKAQIIRI